jgi:hypothetical protein
MLIAMSAGRNPGLNKLMPIMMSITRAGQRAAIVICSLVWGTAHAVVHHDITVSIEPERGEIRVKDRLSIPGDLDSLSLSGAARVLSVSGASVQVHRGGHVLRPAAEARGIAELEYTLPLDEAVDERAPPGSGLYLDAGAAWVATAEGRRHSFALEIRLPAAWTAVSQGERSLNTLRGGKRVVRWRERQPQQEIYLVAGPFTEYTRETDGVLAMAFLRQPDEQLADSYLSATAKYIALYQGMIGPYPYAKFALVENSWDSGYGMPSFTLLGPRVIRLPFIVHTSYPHEIAHNWWGNSVYVDYDSGNWAEGLTSYLADHWLQEQRGQGAQYRRDALQKYLSFVSAEKDFPLTEFRSRHGEATQAVGYHKTMMFFHMLRRRLGDEAFFRALQRFYRQFRFRVAAFSDLQSVFQTVSHEPLQGFFTQWVERTGAPELALDEVSQGRTADGFRVRGRLRQTQAGEPYALIVPVRAETRSGVTDHQVVLDGREGSFTLELRDPPLRVAADPGFDLFRKLDPGEVPAALGAVYGAERLTFVLPRVADAKERSALTSFVEGWREPGRLLSVLYDDQLLPSSGALWLLGWRNARRGMLDAALAAAASKFDGDAVALAGESFAAATDALVLAGRDPAGRPLAWTHLAGADAASTARRLRHYSRYSYVAFRDGRAIARGQWPVTDSPLMVNLPR